MRQQTLTIGAGQGLRGRYGSGGLDRACSVGVGFGEAAEGDFEAEGAEPVSRCHAGRRSSRTVGPGTPRPSACTLQHITVSPSKIGDIVRAHPRPHHFEHGYIP
jgi:hypothetical protein